MFAPCTSLQGSEEGRGNIKGSGGGGIKNKCTLKIFGGRIGIAANIFVRISNSDNLPNLKNRDPLVFNCGRKRTAQSYFRKGGDKNRQ